MKLIQINGNPYERGKAHGTQFREDVKLMVHTNKQILQKDVESYSLRVPAHQEVLNLVSAGLPYATEFAPDLLEEVRGIADGSGLALEEVLTLNCFLDISIICFEQFHSSLLPGCTSFATAGAATADDHTYIGQNYDWSVAFRPGAALMRIESPSSPTVVCLTIAGMVGCAGGMNSTGLGIAINALVPEDSRPGVPYTFVLRKALEHSKYRRCY
jgi:isopenicillin-N N-acyltransferase-like protein